MQQIEDKNYDTDMIDRGIIEITKYGVAFCGKKCGDSSIIVLNKQLKIVMEQLDNNLDEIIRRKSHK